jgi:hypothetical protein
MEGTSQACLVIGCNHALGLIAAAAIQVVVKVKIEYLETTSEAAERAEARLVCLSRSGIVKTRRHRFSWLFRLWSR